MASSDYLARVLIVEDHLLVVSALASVLEGLAGVECIGSVPDGISAIASARADPPDLMIVDLSLPMASGTQVLGELRRWCTGTRLLVVTGQTSPAQLGAALVAGADGIVSKRAELDEIRSAILAVLAGETWIGSGIRELLAQSDARAQLTPREAQILGMLANGLTNREISARLSISPKTADNHRTHLMAKLGVHSRAELLIYAMRHGLIDTENPTPRK